MASVYILYSASIDRYYVGSTTDLARRLKDHLRGNTQSTRRGKPWTCVFSQEIPDISGARSLERKLKSYKSRNILEKIIRSGFIK
jgi:putative endonuclease